MKKRSVPFRRGIWLIAVFALLVAMGLGTKVVSGAELASATPKSFSASDYAAKTFPKVQKHIIENATDLAVVATALKANAADATKTYGVVEGSSFPVFSVTVTAVAGKADSQGIIPVAVDGVPSGVTVRIQTGPAISGTDLRDATGTIHFPDFTNQIQYQDAGSALNDELKKQVLAKITASELSGKTITVTGAFQLVNPASFLITPVQIEVK
jgi:predicted lipoprotein